MQDDYKIANDYNDLVNHLKSGDVSCIVYQDQNLGEMWKQLNSEPDIHVGLRGARWSVAKDIPIITINGVRCIFVTDKEDPKWDLITSEAYKDELVQPLMNFDIIDLMDPTLEECLDKVDGELSGWDYETRGFPMEIGFKPLGFSISCKDYGVYIDFRHYTDYRTRPEFLKLKQFLLRNQKNLITYNCAFEQRCFVHMFDSWIYPLDAMAAAFTENIHTNLKALAQMKLHIPSWDDELDYEMKLLDEYNKTGNKDLVKKVLENRKRLDPDADLSLYKSIKEGAGNVWEQCYPPALAKYCILDSYYTLLCWEKLAPLHTEECLDVFHKNFYHNTYLKTYGMPVRVDVLNKLVPENRLLNKNAEMILNRMYGELLEATYGNVKYDEVLSPIQIKMIELGRSDLLNQDSVKVLKELCKECFESDDPTILNSIYGKDATVTILSTVSENDLRSRKIWTELVKRLGLDTGIQNPARDFNLKFNKDYLDMIPMYNSLSIMKSPIKNMPKISKYRRFFIYNEDRPMRLKNKKFENFIEEMPQDIKDWIVDWISPENLEYIESSYNPKFFKWKDPEYTRSKGDWNKYLDAVGRAEYSDQYRGFSKGNFIWYREWIPFRSICDLIKYRSEKEIYNQMDNYTSYEEMPEYPEPMISLTSEEDGFQLLDLLELNYSDFMRRSYYLSEQNFKYSNWTNSADEYLNKEVDLSNFIDIREAIYPGEKSLRNAMMDKWWGFNTFAIIYSGDLLKKGYYKYGSDKLTLPPVSDLKFYFMVLQFLSLKFGSDKQDSPYMNGNNGFNAARYKVVEETDQYKSIDPNEKGEFFKVNFQACEKSTGRWSSFYHTLPAHQPHDENYALGLTPKQMEEGRIISYFDISQMEPRTLAYDSKCKNFMDDYNNKRDVYFEMAKAYSELKSQEEGTPMPSDKEIKSLWRSKFKRILLGTTYGLGNKNLAMNLGSTVDQAIEMKRFFFNRFPEIEEYIEKCRKYASDHGGLAWTMFGNKIRMDPARVVTQALNYRIQGGASLFAVSGFWNAVTAAKMLGLFINPMGMN